MTTILKFDGEQAFLSNFYPSPIQYDGKEWPTVEHAFQAQKAMSDGEQELIRMAETPGKAKRIGRKVAFLRPDWDEAKTAILYDLLWLKFTQHPELGDRLRATGSAPLIEGNLRHDNIWGDCGCETCADIEGQNRLGELLMQVRDELNAQQGPTASNP